MRSQLTIENEQSVADLIMSAANSLFDKGEPVTVQALRYEFQHSYPEAFAANAETFAAIGFDARARQVLKNRNRQSVTLVQLSLDLGIDEGISLPEMIVIPTGEFDDIDATDNSWKATLSVTIPELDRHLAMRARQISDSEKQWKALQLLRQRAVQYIGVNSDKTLADAALIARRSKS